MPAFVSGTKRERPLRPRPSPPAGTEHLSVPGSAARRPHSHYCASLTPASRSSSSRPCRARLFSKDDPTSRPARFRLRQRSVDVRARARARTTGPSVPCVRGERPPRGHASWSSRFDYRHGTAAEYHETLLGERGKCDVRDWPLAGPSARVRDTTATPVSTASCKMTAAVRRRWPSPSTAAACCWLLVALGIGQVSTRVARIRRYTCAARREEAHGIPTFQTR